VTPNKLALAAAALLACNFIAPVATGRAASSDKPAALPDWSGQWENVGGTPDASGGFNERLDDVLKHMQWSPPNKPELQARVEKIQARERHRLELIAEGKDPGGVDFAACTFGYPMIMLDSPLMFEVLPTPKETSLIFSSREIRTVYTDGRPHPSKDDLWATPWGDSIGHWEGQTLVIDTIAVKSPFASSESGGVAVLAFGDVEGAFTITVLSPNARFIERIRMIDPGHLEDQMTVIDPDSFTKPWQLSRTYQRVTHIHRMVYEDCEGEDRNPVVNGRFIVAPPPGESKLPPAAPGSTTVVPSTPPSVPPPPRNQ
jgi:hypothetical protein